MNLSPQNPKTPYLRLNFEKFEICLSHSNHPLCNFKYKLEQTQHYEMVEENKAAAAEAEVDEGDVVTAFNV